MRLVTGALALSLFGVASAQAQLPTIGRPTPPTTDRKPSELQLPTIGRSNAPIADRKAPEVKPEADFRIGVGKLPAAPTPGERLVVRFDRFAPDMRLLPAYVARSEGVRASNELQREEAIQAESRRLRQVSVDGEFWVAGTVAVGPYNRERGGFPILESKFTVPDRHDLLAFQVADSSSLLFIPLQPSEAELVLAETGNARQLRVIAKATPAGMEVRKVGGADKAVLFGDLKSVVVWTPKRDNQQQAFLVASLSTGETASGGAAEPKPAARAEIGALNFETIDLMLVKHAPDLVTDDMYLNMLANRWSHERTPPKRMVPVSHLPRFFQPNQPPPNAVDSRRMLDRFKSWAKQQADTLPDRYQGLFSNASSMWFQCSFYKGLGMGGETQIPPRLQGVMDAGEYAALRQTYEEQAKANRAQIASDPNPDRHYRMGPLYFSMGVPHGSRPEIDGDVGCPNGQAYQSAVSSVMGGRKASGLPRTVVEIKDWVVPAAEAGSVPNVKESRVTGQVTGVRVAKGIEGPIVVIAFAPTLAEELNSWDASNIKVEKTINYASTSVRQALVVPEKPPEPKAATKPPHDIVGIRVGMTFEEAEKAIAAHMAVGTRINFRPASGGVVQFSTGRIYVRDDKREYITLVDQPPVAKGKVLAVGRMVLEQGRTINAAHLLEDLAEKYGVRHRYVASGLGDAYQSGGQKPGSKTPDGACYTVTGARPGVVYETEDGKPVPPEFFRLPERPTFSTDHLLTMGFRTEFSTDQRNFAACLPHASAILPAREGMIDHFTIWITDPAVHYKALIDAMAAGPARPRTTL